MAYKVLEQNGVINENVDGAGFNYFASGKRDGILGGILNECTVYSPASNIVSISTGVISVQGFRVKITSDISWAVSGNADEYSLVFEIVLNPDRSVSSQFIAQSSSLNLIKDDLLANEEGTHQIEVIRFNWDGNAVSNISRRLPVIIAGSGSGGASVEVVQETGESESAVMSQKAVTDALGGKVDALPVNAGRWAYVTSPENPNTRLLLSGSANQTGNIPLYVVPANTGVKDHGATFNVTMPVNPYNATNKQYVDGKVQPLEQGVYNALGTVYTTEEVTDFGVGIGIPSGAMKYAYIESLGVINGCDNDGKVIGKCVLRGVTVGENNYEIQTPMYIEIPDGAISISIEADVPTGTVYTQGKGGKIVFQVKVGA